MRRPVVNQQMTVALAVVATLAAGGCSKMTSPSPISPSPAVTASAPGTSGATISGQVISGAGSSLRSAAVGSGLTVSIVGTSVSASVDGSGRFRLDNSPSGELELQFQGGGVNVRVKIGTVAEHERVAVQISLSGSSGTVEASEHVGPDDQAEVEGRILSINAASRTITVGTSTIQVSSGTSIQLRGNSVAFESLQVQQRVEVKGPMTAGVVNATEIHVEDDGAPGLPPEAEVEFTGTVSSSSGTCPSLALMVGTTSVMTGSATDFRKVGCGDVKAGLLVEVKGSRLSDGSVLASRLTLESK
jgi:hypothetical protein